MPYLPHEHLDELSDPEAPLWRYMDLAKLVSVLVDKALFFPSGKTLAKQDRFEGQPTYAEVAELNRLATPPPPETLNTIRDELLASFREAAPAEQKWHMAIIKSISFFNCWHMNDYQSDAMWKIYDTGNRGVAIRSTVGRLTRSFAATDKPIYIGAIRYCTEPDNSPPNTKIYVWRFMRKRRAFEHEKELRAIVIDGEQRGLTGIKVPVYIDDLISNVVISPYAESWAEPLVKNLACRLGYKFDVVRSDAARPPPSSLLSPGNAAV